MNLAIEEQEMDFNRKTNKRILEEKTEYQMTYLSFPMLDETNIVKTAFSTRMGGASKGCFGEANFSYTRGDIKENVDENYRIMSKIFGYNGSLDNFVTTYQTHTANVRRVTEDDRGKGVCKLRDYVDVDGLITNLKDVILVTFHADCPPVYFVDPVNKAIGLSHSGWKGTVSRIGTKTVLAMVQEFGTNPKDLLCAIGPSICADCYEVSVDVADRFIEEFGLTYSNEMLSEDQVCDCNKIYQCEQGISLEKGDRKHQILWKKSDGKFQLNLWAAIEKTLIEAGVSKENIFTTDICTKCNSDLLFSHRVMGDKRGNLAAFIALK